VRAALQAGRKAIGVVHTQLDAAVPVIVTELIKGAQ
jgi:hypothetical protein